MPGGRGRSADGLVGEVADELFEHPDGDVALRQPELDEVVVHALVGRGSAKAGVDDRAVPAEQSRDPDVAEVATQEWSRLRGVPAAGGRGITRAECLGGGSA